jgi:pimeloyl-ACP methyl ester carboxylesterase
MSENWFFLRGLVRESGHWAGFLEKFKLAFPDRRVVPLDLPGSGAHFRETSPVSIAGYVEALRAEFLAQRGEKNFLFAISLGGMVGVEWMHRHPADFNGAVLVNTSLRGLSPLHHRLRLKNWGTVLRLLTSGSLALREQTILEMTSGRRERFAALAPEWVEIQRQRPVAKRNALRQLLAAIKFRPPASRPQPKILLLNGAQDQLVHPRCSEALAHHWGAPLRVHPTAQHDLTLDEPEWVLEQLRDFFKR